jgi:hypothetical protein
VLEAKRASAQTCITEWSRCDRNLSNIQFEKSGGHRCTVKATNLLRPSLLLRKSPVEFLIKWLNTITNAWSGTQMNYIFSMLLGELSLYIRSPS